MDFQVVINATEKNEAEKGTKRHEARGNGAAILKRVVPNPCRQTPAPGKVCMNA